MNTFKIHCSFILPLLIVCFCFEFVFMIDKTIEFYEHNLNKDYSVVVVSSKELKDDDFKNIELYKNHNILSPDSILNQLKKDISEKNIKILEEKLPKFYSINFKRFLDEGRVNDVKKELLKIPNVLKVETFSKTHIKTYKLLIFIKFISYVCFVCISLLSFVVFLKQVKIWTYENRERIYILNLFGASFTQRASKMFQIVIIDNIVSSLILGAIFLNFYNLSFILDFFKYLEIELPVINFLPSLIKVFLVSTFLSFLSVIIVMSKTKK